MPAIRRWSTSRAEVRGPVCVSQGDTRAIRGRFTGFRATVLDFESKCWALATELLSLFSDKLGFERDFFTRAHDPASSSYQSTPRLLHYFPLPSDADLTGVWRAGAQQWTPVHPSDDAITCNIGDMLMRWSDDLLPSNFHRVRSPGPSDHRGARYSIAFFAQANSDTIAGPKRTYPPISAKNYLQQRINANFTR